jgi:hypothetical protein
MSYDYHSAKVAFYESIEGTPLVGTDIFFDGSRHFWIDALAGEEVYKTKRVFVGNPVENDWTYQLVYLPADYDASKYFEDRGF